MKWIALLSVFLFAVPALPQTPVVNAESAAKAKDLFDRAVAALGSDAFLNVQTSRLEGRIFGSVSV